MGVMGAPGGRKLSADVENLWAQLERKERIPLRSRMTAALMLLIDGAAVRGREIVVKSAAAVVDGACFLNHAAFDNHVQFFLEDRLEPHVDVPEHVHSPLRRSNSWICAVTPDRSLRNSSHGGRGAMPLERVLRLGRAPL